MDEAYSVSRGSYVGLFLVTLSTLMYEILLTRIFSVTMFYHFAFMAISIAMFGMTVGALLVYIFPDYFSKERTQYHLTLGSLIFSVTMVLSFLSHLCIPFLQGMSFLKIFSLTLTYSLISIPFIFSGICVCLALTRFPLHAGKLYAADLLGAAIGCFFLTYLLDYIDAPSSVMLVAFFGALGSYFFNARESNPVLGKAGGYVILTISLVFVSSTFSFQNGDPILRLIWIKGQYERNPALERWNSFSDIRLYGNPFRPVLPIGWGMSPTLPEETRVHEIRMLIDANAATFITYYNGDPARVRHLKYDITNLVHYLKKDARVLVIGAGGGRDVLSALLFDQRSVTAVEINHDILDIVNNLLGDFTGHLDRDPRVTFVEDEARSYIARTPQTYDIIQVSLIDTWAASSSGAFVLTENSLYTTEAWSLFLKRLSPGGILTFSRWYFKNLPGELYRLTSLASASLMQAGIEDPGQHIIMLGLVLGDYENEKPAGVGTILVSPDPFSEDDIQVIKDVANKMEFEVLLTPEFASDDVFRKIASGRDLETFYREYPINISPPTDESPFFFNMLRLRDLFNQESWSQGNMTFNMSAVALLGILLIIVGVLTLLCILVPLAVTADRSALLGSRPFFIYFAGIGFGFMFIEISQLQRLIIFLGHPTYSLTVVLFSLLLSSGLGSLTTQRIVAGKPGADAYIRLFLLLAALAFFGLLTPSVITAFSGAVTKIRILMAIAILLPLGFMMGMAFPMGLKKASEKSISLTPWLWGINGATSVFASVLAVAIAMNFGISTTFWMGFACYCAAVAAYARSGKSRQ